MDNILHKLSKMHKEKVVLWEVKMSMNLAT